jgi:uncharacterized membrane protein
VPQVPSVVRTIRRLHLRAIVEYLRASLWFVPAVLVTASAVLAVVLNGVDVDGESSLAHLVFPGGPESARAILQAIAGSVITVTGVVFSLTVVTLQLASTQFSPRLLRTFLRDVSNQVVLGTFLATFTYALLVLRAVQNGGDDAEAVVPTLAVTGAYVLTAASVFALVYFIDHIARSIRIDSLMREVNEDTLEVLDLVHPDRRDGGLAGEVAVPDAPPAAVVIDAHRSGFVQAVDDRALLAAAVAHGVSLRIESRVGERVVAGSPLARVWRGEGGCDPTSDLKAAVEDAVQIGFERTMQQDVAFGFRQLVDVAVRALSPGVNDPTTAVHALGHLAALLTVVARREVTPIQRCDDDGVLRVVVPVTDLPGYLDLACGQIRRYGAAEPVVTAELLGLLRDVARCDLPPEHAAAVARQADMVVAAAERSTPEPRDLEPLHGLRAEVQELLAGCRPTAS